MLNYNYHKMNNYCL